MKTKKKLLVSACCCVNLSLLLTAAGCSPPGQSTLATTSISERSSQSESSICPVVMTTMPDQGPLPGHFLTVKNLHDFLPDLQTAAAQVSCAAAWCQPDPQSGQSFLAVADGQLAAEQMNGFFFWLLDPGAGDGQPELLLCIDRLFSDETRETALASGLYSEPRARDLLAFSLRQVLGDCYEPAVNEFILNCYQTVFKNRINPIEPSAQTWTQAFKSMEVTYEASIANSVSFRTISTGAAVA